MGGVVTTPVVIFDSVASAMATTVPTGISWVVLDSSGSPYLCGIGDGAALYPARTGEVIAFTDLDDDASYGYNVISGNVSALAITDPGTGYAPAEVVTLAASAGYFPDGTAATGTVGTVGGGGEIQTLSSFTKGDYQQTPPEAATATTSSVAGTGCTLTPTVDRTVGIVANATGLAVEAYRATNNISVQTVRMPLLHGPTGWYFPSKIEIGIEATTLTQMTDEANIELASHVALQIYGITGLTVPWERVAMHINTTWFVAAQRSTTFTQAAGEDLGAVADGRQLTLSMQSGYLTTGNAVQWRGGVVDRDATSGVATLGRSEQYGAVNLWDFTAADPTIKNRAYVDIIIAAGPTANDQMKWTLLDLMALDGGFDQR